MTSSAHNPTPLPYFPSSPLGNSRSNPLHSSLKLFESVKTDLRQRRIGGLHIVATGPDGQIEAIISHSQIEISVRQDNKLKTYTCNFSTGECQMDFVKTTQSEFLRFKALVALIDEQLRNGTANVHYL